MNCAKYVVNRKIYVLKNIFPSLTIKNRLSIEKINYVNQDQISLSSKSFTGLSAENHR